MNIIIWGVRIENLDNQGFDNRGCTVSIDLCLFDRAKGVGTCEAAITPAVHRYSGN